MTAPEPRGSLVGVMDEYGTIWSGEPGTSDIIGDAVTRSDEETMDVYLASAQGTCDCVPVVVSSKSCRKCGRRGVISGEKMHEHLIDLAQCHYVLNQIASDSVAAEQAADMARRVLAGEKSVTPGSGTC